MRRALVLLALFVWGLVSSTFGAETSPRPNIVLILADDLGYGDLACFGQQRIKTPNIDRLAAEGVRFTQFYAGSTVCAPSRCVLMTGRHSGHAYIRGNGKANLRPEDRTIAEVLKSAGYATGLFGKWGLGEEGSAAVPTRKGFDEFFGYLDQHHAHNYFPAYLFSGESRQPLENVVPGSGPFGNGVATKRVEYSPDLMRERALGFIDRNKDRPFFLYYASILPHANNEAGKKGMEIADYGAYRNTDWPEPEKGLAAMISHLDSDVGRLLAQLRKDGIADRTVVFFSSDNGPHHEGGNDPAFFDSNGPLRGTKRDLYEGGIRVPMIVRWPGHTPPGTVSPYVGYFGDFFATATEIAGIPCPSGLDSISFAPAITGNAGRQQTHPYLYWEFYEKGSAQAVRAGNWKAVIRPFGSRNVELYDLSTDQGESRDLASRNPDRVREMLAIVTAAHDPSPLWKAPDSREPKKPSRRRKP